MVAGDSAGHRVRHRNDKQRQLFTSQVRSYCCLHLQDIQYVPVKTNSVTAHFFNWVVITFQVSSYRSLSLQGIRYLLYPGTNILGTSVWRRRCFSCLVRAPPSWLNLRVSEWQVSASTNDTRAHGPLSETSSEWQAYHSFPRSLDSQALETLRVQGHLAGI